MTSIINMAKRAKAATLEMGRASSDQKNEALIAMMNGLIKSKEAILKANCEDIALGQAKGLSCALIDRLSLQNRLEGIVQDIQTVIDLPDPIGELLDPQILPNKLKVVKTRIPIGVLGVIYESRPNVTIDVSALAIKSGNCAILRGGSETLQTNQALIKVLQEALISAGLPENAIQLVESTDRAEVKELLRLHEHIDMIIPRGSANLQQFCRENSQIPVITGGVGICHLFVDKTADLKRSLDVIMNAKVQRPTVCNALDTLLVHADIAESFIPEVVEMLGMKGVNFRLDPKAHALVQEPSCQLSGPDDFDTEWFSLVLGIKIVQNLNEAIDHIRLHSTSHSDGILTENKQNADLFVKSIDSAVVYVNASMRFTDGSQLGLGSEVAISTQKLHARGPMGLNELTSYKWVVQGDYHFRK